MLKMLTDYNYQKHWWHYLTQLVIKSIYVEKKHWISCI